MRVAADWKDYEIIDTSNGENWSAGGKEFFIRPDPQVIWHTHISILPGTRYMLIIIVPIVGAAPGNF